MSTAIHQDTAQCRVEVHLNGKARSKVRVFRKANETLEFVFSDVANMVSAREQAAVLDRLPESNKHLRPELEDAFRTLGGKIVELQAEAEDDGPLAGGGRGGEFAFEDVQPWPTAVNGAELLSELVSLFERYCVLPDGGAVAVALWALLSWVHDAAYVSPILCVTAPEKRCGKTRVIMVLGVVVQRPASTSNITGSALFRAVQEYGPTLLIDEGDSFLQGKEELRGILNAGHTRPTAYVIRVDPDTLGLRQFSTWGPKAIALIGNLPETLQDRSIVVRMRRRTSTERVAQLRLDRLNAVCEPVRRMARRWANDNLEAVKRLDPAMPDGLDDRQADNWRSLIAIADLAGGDWPHRARRAALLLSGAVLEDASPRVQLLADIRDLFEIRRADRLSSDDIVRHMVSLEDRPWPEWFRGRPLTSTGLARILKPFGIKPKSIRIGTATPKGYCVFRSS